MTTMMTALIAAVGGEIPTNIGETDVRDLSLEDIEFVSEQPLMFGGWALQDGSLVRHYSPDGTDVTLARASGTIPRSAAPAQRFVMPVGGVFRWGAEARDFTENTGQAATAAAAIAAVMAAQI